MVNSPFSFVVVAIFRPFTCTVTPSAGLLSLVTIFPLIVCAKEVMPMKMKAMKKTILFMLSGLEAQISLVLMFFGLRTRKKDYEKGNILHLGGETRRNWMFL
jgi:hypothetical protein